MKKSYVFNFLLFLFVTISLHGFSQTTLTFSSGSWTPYAPSASTGLDNAVVNGTAASIADGAIINSLTINDSKALLLTNEDVTINNDLSLSKSSRLIITGTGSVTVGGNSNINVQGKTNSGSYNIWSSPFVSGVDLYSSFSGVQSNPCDGWTFNASTQAFLYDYNEGFSTSCQGNSVTFSSGDLITDGTADGEMDLGRGYFLPGFSGGLVNLSQSTQFNNGTINIPIYGSSIAVAGGNDWNLIGNPYPSPINAGSVITTNSGLNVNAIYLYNGTNGNYITLSSASSYGIAPGQGFFIEAPTTTNGYIGDFQFLNTHRYNTLTYFFKSESQSPFISFISLTGADYTDQIQIFIDPDCEDGYDYKFDARKLRNDNGLNFSSLIETDPNLSKEHFVFNGIKTFQDEENKVLELFVETNSSGNYEIKIDSLTNMPLGMSIVLEDNATSTMTNLRNSNYTFNSSQPDSLENRFFLHFSYDSDVTSANDFEENSVLSIYTAENNIRVNSISNNIQINEVQVFNIVGGQIAINNTKGFSTTINTKGFQAGVYIVKTIDSTGNLFVKRVIIK